MRKIEHQQRLHATSCQPAAFAMMMGLDVEDVPCWFDKADRAKDRLDKAEEALAQAIRAHEQAVDDAVDMQAETYLKHGVRKFQFPISPRFFDFQRLCMFLHDQMPGMAFEIVVGERGGDGEIYAHHVVFQDMIVYDPAMTGPMRLGSVHYRPHIRRFFNEKKSKRCFQVYFYLPIEGVDSPANRSKKASKEDSK